LRPRNFYEEFPVAAEWASALPPAQRAPDLVHATAVAFFAGSLPHAIYHSTATEALSTADNLFSLAGLYLGVLLPLLVLYLASPRRQEPVASRPAGASRLPPLRAARRQLALG
jgi:hypothetical protein